MEIAGAKYANIAFPIPIDTTFSYLVPEELRGKARAGMRVLAPFGPKNREREGVIVELPEKPEFEKLKEDDVTIFMVQFSSKFMAVINDKL